MVDLEYGCTIRIEATSNESRCAVLRPKRAGFPRHLAIGVQRRTQLSSFDYDHRVLVIRLRPHSLSKAIVQQFNLQGRLNACTFRGARHI